MKTAEEFYEKEYGEVYTGPIDHEDVIDIMVKFTQYHIREALKTAQKKNGLLVDGKEYILDTFCIEKYDSFYSEVEITVKDISNSYPLDLIL